MLAPSRIIEPSPKFTSSEIIDLLDIIDGKHIHFLVFF